MPKNGKKKKKQLEETHLKQNYVDENDLIPFLRDRFGEEFRIRTLEDGSKMVEALRKLSEEEVEWLRQLKENREPRQSTSTIYNQMSLEKSIVETVECIPEWPVRSTAKSAYFFDNSSGDKRVFENNSRRVFADSEKMNLEACTISSRGCKAEKLRSIRELSVSLEVAETSSINGHGSIPASKIFFISQPTSRARFSISECAMKTLLMRIGVFSSFTNILSCFGFENGPNQDGRGGFYENSRKDKTGALILETAYVLKHVEHKAGSNIPWSIRQMAVYQNFNCATKASSNILIQTSQNVQKQVFKLVQEGTMAVFPDHWKNVHEIHLSSLSNNWIDYIKFLESKISDIEDAVRHARRDTPDRVTFATLQQLSKYSDIMIRISHTLQMNITILSKLLETARKRQKLDSKECVEEYESFQESIQTCITEHEFLKHHVALVQSSSQELRALTFLSMGFVHVESLEGVMRLAVSKDMLIYIAITLPLMVATILGWWLWEYMSKRRKRAGMEEDDEEKVKNM
ncbi:hypothetical protein V496_04729 [Pseudogymnoascus sp. VKM F-4515 (FW-2607)]|nr:hypothetical protein V496_04729 [Pseudogymnoascus sp. VKM F-4515 (FW-2607)]